MVLVPDSWSSTRWMRIENEPWRDKLLVSGLHGHEAMSELFRFELDLLVVDGTEVAFGDLLRKRLVVELRPPNEPVRRIAGIVRHLEHDFVESAYRAELVPDVWLLTQNRRCWIFQEKSAPRILEAVLDGFEVDYRLTGSHAPLNYCVQYRESDWEFACRLMAEAGIYFHFEHHLDGCRLILSDDWRLAPPLPHHDHLEFDWQTGGVRDQARIRQWRLSQDVRPTRHRVCDHHFQVPDDDLVAESKLQQESSAGRRDHRLDSRELAHAEVFEPRGRFAHRYDRIDVSGGPRHSELEGLFGSEVKASALMAERSATGAVRVAGGGDVHWMLPGFRFHLEGAREADGQYLIDSVETTASQPGVRSGNTERGTFENRFTCQPADLPFRPPLRAIPEIGAQSGVVVGLNHDEDEELRYAHSDPFARVQVRLYWDKDEAFVGAGPHARPFEATGAGRTCWLRVVQPWAGPEGGFQHVPRIGEEVIVDFLHGDPDLPFVLGSVYNAHNIPPRTQPNYRHQTVLKSRGLVDPSQYQGIGMDPVTNTMQMASSNDMGIGAGRNYTHSVGNSYRQTVGSRRHTTIGGWYNKPLYPSGADSAALPESTEAPTPTNGPGASSSVIGSGSGGGATTTATSTAVGTEHDGGPAGFTNPFTSDGEFGSDSCLIWGLNQAGTVGATSAVCVGWHCEHYFNPIGLLSGLLGVGKADELAQDSSFLMQALTTIGTLINVGGGLGTLGQGSGAWIGTAISAAPLSPFVAGKNEVIMGSQAEITYGAATHIHRGPSICVKSSFRATPENALFTIPIGACAVIYHVFEGLIRYLDEVAAQHGDSQTTQQLITTLTGLRFDVEAFWINFEFASQVTATAFRNNLLNAGAQLNQVGNGQLNAPPQRLANLDDDGGGDDDDGGDDDELEIEENNENENQNQNDGGGGDENAGNDENNQNQNNQIEPDDDGGGDDGGGDENADNDENNQNQNQNNQIEPDDDGGGGGGDENADNDENNQNQNQNNQIEPNDDGGGGGGGGDENAGNDENNQNQNNQRPIDPNEEYDDDGNPIRNAEEW